MKLAFARIGAPHRHAFWNLASFSANPLSLVEQQEMNGLNKEISRSHALKRPVSQPLVNHNRVVGRRATPVRATELAWHEQKAPPFARDTSAARIYAKFVLDPIQLR
jgi:hypothetical protein